MGVSCEERNGVYLRCEAVNDRTKVRCVLKRLGIDFLKTFFPSCSYQGTETSLYTVRHVLIKSQWKRYVSLTLNLLCRDNNTVNSLILQWKKVMLKSDSVILHGLHPIFMIIAAIHFCLRINWFLNGIIISSLLIKLVSPGSFFKDQILYTHGGTVGRFVDGLVNN